MHNKNVDGAVFVSQWPHMPRGEDVFYKMFHTDLSHEATGTLLSSGKPLGICLFGLSETTSKIKQNLNFPIFNGAAEMVTALKKQSDFHAKKAKGQPVYTRPDKIDMASASAWIKQREGAIGEESLELLKFWGIPIADSSVAADETEAIAIAERIAYPVVMKIVSPDAIHKSDAGGVFVGVNSPEEVKEKFALIRENLFQYKKDADFRGVRVMKQASAGYDMFIGGYRDQSFGPVVFFGYGGIYIEVFKDTGNVLCPATEEEIEAKVRKLKSCKILQGTRGKKAGDIKGYISIIARITHLLQLFPEIRELDINPVRILEDGSGVIALDARLMIGR
jgi:acetyltransferase